MDTSRISYNSGKQRRTEVVFHKTANQHETEASSLFTTNTPQGIKLPMYNLTHKREVKKQAPSNKESWLFQEEVEISHLKPEQILREAQNSNASLTTLYNQIYRHPALNGAYSTSLSRVNFSKTKIPSLTLTPAGVVSIESQSTQSTQRSIPRSGRRKFMPQTSVKVQRHQSLQMRGSDQVKLPPLKRNSLLYSMKNKKIIDDFSAEAQLMSERYRTFYSSSYFTQASSIPSPMREEEKNSFEILMKKHSISYQNNELPESLPPLHKIQEITLPSHRKHHELEIIHDAEEPKESHSPLMISQSKQLRAQTNYEKRINEDIAPFITRSDDENRSAKEFQSPPSQLSPLARRFTPIPPDTPLSLKRSIEKIKIVGFILPNGAQVKIKRELHPLLDIATDQRHSPRKYYSPTPQEDITYDTILLKETLEPIKNKQDLPQQKGDLVLLQKKLLDSVPIGNIHNSLVELDPKHVRRDYLKSGGDITLATDLDGASTDSEQPNLIGPLYHKHHHHHHHQTRMSNPMRIEQQRELSEPPRTMYNTVTTMGTKPVEEKQKLSHTFTLFKEIAERKKKKKLAQLSLPQSDRHTYSNRFSTNALHSRINSMHETIYESPSKQVSARNIVKFRKEQEQGELKRLEVEAEMSVPLDALIRKFVNFRDQLRQRYNLSQQELEECLVVFKRLSLLSLKEIHGFVRKDVSRIGIIPQLLCKQLQIPFFVLSGVNSAYSHVELTKDFKGKTLVSWVDFIKLMSLAVYRNASNLDTLAFILRSLCLTKPEQFTQNGLFKAISKAIRHSQFFYPESIRQIWSTIYKKLSSMKSLYLDMEQPNRDLQRLKTPAQSVKTSYFVCKNYPQAGIINHQRLEKVKKRDVMIAKSSVLSLDIEAAAIFLEGYLSEEHIKDLLNYVVEMKV